MLLLEMLWLRFRKTAVRLLQGDLPGLPDACIRQRRQSAWATLLCTYVTLRAAVLSSSMWPGTLYHQLDARVEAVQLC